MATDTTRDDRPVLLALRALKLGDLLVAVPALKAIRRSRPDHRIVLASPAWLEPLARLTEAVDELLPTRGLDEPLRVPFAVDTVVNLHGRGPSSTDLLDALGARVRLGHRGPRWPGPAWVDGCLERWRWARLASWHGMPADPDDVALTLPPPPSPAPGAVVVHVGAFYGSRRWPVERFAEVARALGEGRRIVITSGADEADRAHAVARAAGVLDVFPGTLALDELAGLVAEAALLVSADTGAAHLASAYGTPSVVVFGPAPVAEWGPPPGPHVVLTDESVRRGDTFSDEPDPALLAVSPREVIAAARGLLGG